MIRALTAGTLYFLLVFAAGFCLGVLRVTLIVPQVGNLVATIIELPIMVTVGYFCCRWILRLWSVPPMPSRRWAMVLLFVALLFLFEWQLGEQLFARTAGEQWAALLTPAGLAGLAAQLLTALFPVLLGQAKP